MKIGFPSNQKGLGSEVADEFGRCQYFSIVDTDSMKADFFENENAEERHGAGVGASQFLSSKDVEAVIVRNIGPKAFDALKSGDIGVYEFSGRIKDGINEFKEDNLRELENPSKGGKKRGGGGF